MTATPRPLPGKPWTPEERDTLRRLAEARLPRREISDRLERSASAVSHQAAKLSVGLPPTSAVEAAASLPAPVRHGKPGPVPRRPPDANAADPGFHLKIVRLGRSPLPWIWEVRRDGEGMPRERSARGYRCAEDAWDAGQKPLGRFRAVSC